jgi:hypothetical protein
MPWSFLFVESVLENKGDGPDKLKLDDSFLFIL